VIPINVCKEGICFSLDHQPSWHFISVYRWANELKSRIVLTSAFPAVPPEMEIAL